MLKVGRRSIEFKTCLLVYIFRRMIPLVLSVKLTKTLFREDWWKEKEQVEMKWGRKDYNGTIIRIHGTFYLTFSMYVLQKYQALKYQQINMSLTSFSFIIFLNLCRVNPTIIWLHVFKIYTSFTNIIIYVTELNWTYWFSSCC